MEKEPVPYSVEDKFKQQIGKRFNLWTSIIEESGVSQETKNEIIKILSDFRDNAFDTNRWQDVGDAFYGVITLMLTATEHDDNKAEAKVLFHNIRDDVWALFKEIKN